MKHNTIHIMMDISTNTIGNASSETLVQSSHIERLQFLL